MLHLRRCTHEGAAKGESTIRDESLVVQVTCDQHTGEAASLAISASLVTDMMLDS